MNVFQKRFFARRMRLLSGVASWERRREMDAHELIHQLASLSEAQAAAIERLAQRVIDGRTLILSRCATLPEASMHEARGAIMGMQDFLDGFRSLREEALGQREGDGE